MGSLPEAKIGPVKRMPKKKRWILAGYTHCSELRLIIAILAV